MSRVFYALGIIVFGFAVLIGIFAHPALDINRRRQILGYLDIRKLIAAVDRYKSDCGRYPSLAGGLDTLVHSPGAACWKGSYLDGEVPADPWRRAFVYRLDNGQPEVISFGADGKPGGEFFDMDISSRNVWVFSPESPTEIRTRRIWIALWLGAWVGFLGCAYLLRH